jgi:hypothetical protein
MQHVHFPLIAQITKCQVSKHETWYFKWTRIVFVSTRYLVLGDRYSVLSTWSSVVGTRYSVLGDQWLVVSTRDSVVNIGK